MKKNLNQIVEANIGFIEHKLKKNELPTKELDFLYSIIDGYTGTQNVAVKLNIIAHQYIKLAYKSNYEN